MNKGKKLSHRKVRMLLEKLKANRTPDDFKVIQTELKKLDLRK